MVNRKILVFGVIGVIITSVLIFFLILIVNLGDQDINEQELNRISFNIGGMEVDDFAYWLQNIDINEIEDSNYDLIIMDYSSDGNESGEYSNSQINYMKSLGSKQKLLLSYISIGEAETYRFYWNKTWDLDQNGEPDIDAPEWLDIENPEWEGNYKVKYWMQSWQEIIYEYLDRIIAAGFDGIYMDIIDAYEYYGTFIPHSEWLMIDFVGNISNYVKTEVDQDFIVFVQNGDALLQNSTYLNYIDGVGREDLFYDDNIETDNNWRVEGIQNLNFALNDGKAIFIIDYPTEALQIYDFYSKSINNGYLPYASERDLDSIKEYSFYTAT